MKFATGTVFTVFFAIKGLMYFTELVKFSSNGGQDVEALITVFSHIQNLSSWVGEQSTQAGAAFSLQIAVGIVLGSTYMLLSTAIGSLFNDLCWSFGRAIADKIYRVSQPYSIPVEGKVGA